jgi:hypothetical protein
VQAIQAHTGGPSDCGHQPGNNDNTRCTASEANGVIAKFNALTAAQQQDILNFLRSL